MKIKSLLLWISGSLVSGLAFAQERPNIVFLMSDDQSTYTLGCYGNDDVITPNIDKLAEDGMAFDRHYATTAICMASRAQVMSGLFEYKTGANFHHGAMAYADWERSYPFLLREAGYRTAFAGKFGFRLKNDPANRRETGFEPEDDFDDWAAGNGQTSYRTERNDHLGEYVDEFPHATLAYAAFGSDFIRDSVAEDKPFCLSISFKAPHRPVQPDPRFNDVYNGVTLNTPENFGRENGSHFSLQSRQGRQYARFSAWNYDDNYQGVMARYHQQVHGIDAAVGMVREALEAAGVADNTVIIYTADNGFLCGSHGYGSKVLPYEEASRVPMIIFDPRHRNSGRELRSASLTGNVDVAPTILRLAGLPIPSRMDGKSMMPLYQNPSRAIHESLPLINAWANAETQSLSVVTRDYKYIYWYYGGEEFTATEELYSKNDPLELTNLANSREHRRALRRMRSKYDDVVQAWKDEVVSYNNYSQFGTLFDRSIPWADKSDLARDF